MSIFEYDEEKHLKCEREWAYQEGENHLASLLQFLIDAGRTEDAFRAISDPAYRAQLYQETPLDPSKYSGTSI